MSSKTHFLALPYDVRDQIYQHYFMVDGGYVYDGDSEKLVTADGQPIDLSLMYTCHLIAQDTKHMPLSVNPITFSTVFREDWREQAGGLEFIVNFHRLLQSDLIVHLEKFMTPEMFSRLGHEFPQSIPNIRRYLMDRRRIRERDPDFYPRRQQSPYFQSLVRGSREGRYSEISSYTCHDRLQWIWGTTKSSISSAVDLVLRLLAEKHPADFAQVIDEVLPGWTDSHSPDEFFGLTFDHWAIPSLSEVIQIADQLQAHDLCGWLGYWHHGRGQEGIGYRFREKFCFSAAAVAIRFLDRLPKHQRLHIRNIVINEDRTAVGFPQGHILGLIPFCKENPRLRLQQRVNLWRTILLKAETPDPLDVRMILETNDDGFPPEYENRGLEPFRVYTALASWGFQTMEVMDEGMPAGSFSFVLDGEPDMNLSSDLFDRVVHRDIAWMKSYLKCLSQGLVPHPNQDQYIPGFATYIRGVEHLISGPSFVQSNFNLGQPWDYEKLMVEHQEPSLSVWQEKQRNREPVEFDVDTPTLKLPELQLELFEHQSESDYLDSSLNTCKREKKRLRRVRRRWAAAIAAQNPTQVAEANDEDDDEDDAEDMAVGVDVDMDNLVSHSDAKMGLVMRTLFGDVHKVPPCMTRTEKRMYRKERRAQKTAASAPYQSVVDLAVIEDMDSDMDATTFGNFFEPRTGLWWW
ncbi:hypothetical protein FALBO_4597 [Fusarium albosuccineum]|uniref:Uncharacterized protein n=1 Tax=Fusarium albosuccineum TaxID=1237068 RepID=A0A8H4LGU0_9HYPO|nr:hypothetical protein FALBO_4597 [Fusarium albosuccineum]